MTETQNEHPLVTRYLKDLERALRDVPAGRRTEILDDIKEHIADAAADRGEWMTESELRSLLDQVGHPEMIAEDARERLGIRRRRGGAMEGIAIGSLLIGGLIVPLLGWVLGVVLLWASGVWNTRDKILGTLLVPGGLMTPLFFGGFAVGVTRCVDFGGVDNCSEATGVFFRVADVILLVFLVIAPIAVAIYLGRKAFRRP